MVDDHYNFLAAWVCQYVLTWSRFILGVSKAAANWAVHEEPPPSGVYPEPVEGATLSEAILRTPKYPRENWNNYF